MMRSIYILILSCVPVMANQPFDLRCDYRVKPLAVEWEHPGLSWKVQVTQKTYHIQASKSKQGFTKPELWDSGWVQSDSTTQILYAGKPVLPVKQNNTLQSTFSERIIVKSQL